MKRWTLLFACLCGPIFLFAATITWDGGAATTNWSDANNWDTDVLPTNTDDVIINSATVNVNLNTFVRTLTLTGSASLTVNTDYTLTLGNTTGSLLQVLDASSVVLNGIMTVIGNESASTRTISINTSGSFGIANGGELQIFGFNGDQQEGIGIESGNFTNNGEMNFSSGKWGIGGHGSFAFVNGSTGRILMTGITDTGIRYTGNGAIFANNNYVSISAPIAIQLQDATNIFNNNDSLVAVTEDFVIKNTGSGTFNNNTNGILITTGTGVISSARFVNNGGKLAPNGYMNFDASEDFTNAIINIDIYGDGGNAPIDFDQIVVNGTATLDDASTVLYLRFHFTPMVGDLFKVMNATTISGMFSAINVQQSHGVIFNDATGEIQIALLPIELAGFRANKLNDEVELTWQTASETENEGFAIERSVNGAIWHELGFVPGHGTTLEPQHYHFLDEKPLPGLNYYRLRQMDLNGEQSYSGMVSVAFDGKDSRFSLFPNPAWEGIATLLFQSEEPWSEGILEVFDQIGKLILQTTVSPAGNGGFAIPIDLSSYASGVYTVRLGVNKKSVSERLVISRRS